MNKALTIALTKGRILKETLPLLAAAGIEPTEDVHTSRKLVFATNRPGVQLVIIRGTDVPTYVRHGAADMGVVGKDILMEHALGGEAPQWGILHGLYCYTLCLSHFVASFGSIPSVGLVIKPTRRK